MLHRSMFIDASVVIEIRKVDPCRCGQIAKWIESTVYGGGNLQLTAAVRAGGYVQFYCDIERFTIKRSHVRC